MASFWEHSSTKREIVEIQEKLRGIADSLGAIGGNAVDIERLEQAVVNVSQRLCMLKLSMEDPTSPSSLARRY